MTTLQMELLGSYIRIGVAHLLILFAVFRALVPILIIQTPFMILTAITHNPMLFFFFFLKDPAPTEFSPLPLHAALPICVERFYGPGRSVFVVERHQLHRPPHDAALGVQLLDRQFRRLHDRRRHDAVYAGEADRHGDDDWLLLGRLRRATR